MAVAYDAQGLPAAAPGFVSDFSWSHTSTGSNRAIIVVVCNLTTNTPSATGVTVNGVTCGQRHTSSQAGTNSCRISLYSLKAQDTGAQTVAVSMGFSARATGASVSATNVDQTTEWDATSINSGGGSDQSPTVTCTTVAGQYLVGGVSVDKATSSARTFTAGGGQTEVMDHTSGSHAGTVSREAVAGASTVHSYSISGTITGGGWRCAAMAFLEVTAGAPLPSKLWQYRQRRGQ